MGIDIWNLRLLLEAARQAPFGDLVQIGRQGIHVWQPDLADAMLHSAGFGTFAELTGGNNYADQGLLQALGATSAIALDASDYEGAQIVQDMNDPLPPQHHQSVDTVFDGGSLEHIFNVPVALANMMNMLRIGGRLVTTIPANNWLGHGFYQFSPELPFRVFTPANGFRLRNVYLNVMNDKTHMLTPARDSGSAGVRGEIGFTQAATGLMFIAEKTDHIVPFAKWPQQGDYAHVWESGEAHQDNPANFAQRPGNASLKTMLGGLARRMRR